MKNVPFIVSVECVPYHKFESKWQLDLRVACVWRNQYRPVSVFQGRIIYIYVTSMVQLINTAKVVQCQSSSQHPNRLSNTYFRLLMFLNFPGSSGNWWKSFYQYFNKKDMFDGVILFCQWNQFQCFCHSVELSHSPTLIIIAQFHNRISLFLPRVVRCYHIIFVSRTEHRHNKTWHHFAIMQPKVKHSLVFVQYQNNYLRTACMVTRDICASFMSDEI